MAFPINKIRQKFKEKFLEEVVKLEYGGFFTDAQVEKFLDKHRIDFDLKEAMICIRQLEDRIGLEHKKRLKRIRGEGYLVLEPEVQANTALREGKQKVQVALKKTSKRLDAVDVSEFTPEQQRELLSRTAAVDSLLSIVKGSAITRKIMTRKELKKIEGN